MHKSQLKVLLANYNLQNLQKKNKPPLKKEDIIRLEGMEQRVKKCSRHAPENQNPFPIHHNL